MKKHSVVCPEKSTEKRMKKLKDTLERCTKDTRPDTMEGLSDKNRKSANIQKNLVPRKDNIKKLSLAIASYFDIAKIADRKTGCSSNKNEDAANKKLFSGKYNSLLLGSKPTMTIPSGIDEVSKQISGSRGRFEEKSPVSVCRPTSISNPKAKIYTDKEFKAESYRVLHGEEGRPATLMRDKTIPKLSAHPEVLLSRGTGQSQVKGVKGSTMFKACINSISKKVDHRAPVKDHKAGKKGEKYVYLSSMTNYSDKGDLHLHNRGSKAGMKIDDHRRGVEKSMYPRDEILTKAVKASLHLIEKGGNKENESSRINVHLQVTSTKLKTSNREESCTIRRVTEPDDDYLDTKSVHLPRTSQKITTKTRPKIQTSGEYMTSEDPRYDAETRSNCKPTISKFDDGILGLSKKKASCRRTEEELLPGRRFVMSKIKDDVSAKGDGCDDVMIDHSFDSSVQSIKVKKDRGLKCDESGLLLDLHEQSEEDRPISGGESASPHSDYFEGNELSDPEILKNLILSEKDYQFNPHYLETRTTCIKWNMRAILLDWMIEVADDMDFKRSTFYYAANYLDRYLSTGPNVTTKVLQLVGLTCLCLAAKLEEILVPGLQDFSQVTLNTFTVEDIERTEISILKALKWRMNPPTFYIWANWYTCHWDVYIETNPFACNHRLVKSKGAESSTFRKLNMPSYNRYRKLMQLLDCAILEVHTLQYKIRPLIGAFMYIVIGLELEQFTSAEVLATFATSSQYLLDTSIPFNSLFAKFLELYFGVTLEELLPSVQFASTFLGLEPNNDLPSAVKNNKKEILSGHFEEFLAYQTHHPSALNYIIHRRANNV